MVCLNPLNWTRAHQVPDFLMKYIIIGVSHHSGTADFGSKTHCRLQERQGQANHACCTTSPTMHVRCPLLYGVSVSGCLTVKDHSQHTIGVEFSSRTVKLGEKRIKLQVCHAFQ